MKTCKTCQHWGEYSKALGRCKKIPLHYDAFEWRADSDNLVVKEKYKDVKAFAQDGSDYIAFLLTQEDFMCVMHEEN